MNATRIGISDLLLLTAYVAILLALYFSNDLVALCCTAALLFMLQHYARRFATIRQSGLYFALGALAGYMFCELYFQVPFFFASPRLGLICFCMTLGGSLGIGLHVANASGSAK
jgi:hypothetical protein